MFVNRFQAPRWWSALNAMEKECKGKEPVKMLKQMKIQYPEEQ